MATKLYTGYTFDTKSGPATVTAYHSCNHVEVTFDNTGYVTIARSCHIRNGIVKDKSIVSETKQYYMNIAERKARRYTVVEKTGDTKMFPSIRAIQDAYNISAGTIRKLLNLGDINNKYFTSIVCG